MYWFTVRHPPFLCQLFAVFVVPLPDYSVSCPGDGAVEVANGIAWLQLVGRDVVQFCDRVPCPVDL